MSLFKRCVTALGDFVLIRSVVNLFSRSTEQDEFDVPRSGGYHMLNRNRYSNYPDNRAGVEAQYDYDGDVYYQQDICGMDPEGENNYWLHEDNTYIDEEDYL